MRKYSISENGYILAFGVAEHGGETISDERYAAIQSAMDNRPEDTATVTHALRDDLTWEAQEADPDADPYVDDAQAFQYLFGGDT